MTHRQQLNAVWLLHSGEHDSQVIKKDKNPSFLEQTHIFKHKKALEVHLYLHVPKTMYDDLVKMIYTHTPNFTLIFHEAACWHNWGLEESFKI